MVGVIFSSSRAQHFMVLLPLSTQEYYKMLVNGLGNLKNHLQWVICDGLIFIHPSMASCNTSSFCYTEEYFGSFVSQLDFTLFILSRCFFFLQLPRVFSGW